jgi:hypothetical protein
LLELGKVVLFELEPFLGEVLKALVHVLFHLYLLVWLHLVPPRMVERGLLVGHTFLPFAFFVLEGTAVASIALLPAHHHLFFGLHALTPRLLLLSLCTLAHRLLLSRLAAPTFLLLCLPGLDLSLKLQIELLDFLPVTDFGGVEEAQGLFELLRCLLMGELELEELRVAVGQC